MVFTKLYTEIAVHICVSVGSCLSLSVSHAVCYSLVGVYLELEHKFLRTRAVSLSVITQRQSFNQKMKKKKKQIRIK